MAIIVSSGNYNTLMRYADVELSALGRVQLQINTRGTKLGDNHMETTFFFLLVHLHHAV